MPIRKTLIVGTLAFALSAPLTAQTSAVERANKDDQGSAAYRTAHCKPGNEEACARATKRDEGAIAYRNAHASADARDPNLAAKTAAKDKRADAYRDAHCAADNKAACARANARK
jgi:hypothetical protein